MPGQCEVLGGGAQRYQADILQKKADDWSIAAGLLAAVAGLSAWKFIRACRQDRIYVGRDTRRRSAGCLTRVSIALEGLPVVIQLTKPLIVPEFETARVKLYVDHPVTHQTVAVPSYTIDVQRIVSRLFDTNDVKRRAKANACALLGDDLFISNSSDNSQCIFKLPNYLNDGSAAMAEAFVLTLVGGSFVGLAFDNAGNLFAAEGFSDDNGIVKYTGTDKPLPRVG